MTEQREPEELFDAPPRQPPRPMERRSSRHQPTRRPVM